MSKTSPSPQTSKPPAPPSSGNSLKYIAIGLFFLGGVVALLLLTDKGDKPAPPPPPPPQVERVNPMEEPQLDLDEPEPEPEQAATEEPAPAKTGKPRRTGGEWDCSGDLPNALKVINENRPQIRSCYERRLKLNNVLAGDMTLRLKVGSTGKVVATAVAGSIRDQQVFACVRSLAQTWTFPVPSGGACAVVQVPFQFSPKNP